MRNNQQPCCLAEWMRGSAPEQACSEPELHNGSWLNLSSGMLCTTEYTLKLVQADESHASLDAHNDDSSLVLYRDPSRASAQSRGSVMSGNDLQESVWMLQSHSQPAAFPQYLQKQRTMPACTAWPAHSKSADCSSIVTWFM